MPNYKVQFMDKANKPIKDEILVFATSVKNAIREACRVGGFEYPSKNNAKVSEIKLVQSKPSENKAKKELQTPS